MKTRGRFYRRCYISICNENLDSFFRLGLVSAYPGAHILSDVCFLHFNHIFYATLTT